MYLVFLRHRRPPRPETDYVRVPPHEVYRLELEPPPGPVLASSRHMKPEDSWSAVLRCALVGLTASPRCSGPDGEPGAGRVARLERLPAGFLDAGGVTRVRFSGTGALRCWGVGSTRPARLRQHGFDRRQRDCHAGSARSSWGRAGGRSRSAPAPSTRARILDTRDCALLGRRRAPGRLGYGNRTRSATPRRRGRSGRSISGSGRRAVAISAGGEHTCAILDNGTVRCWGYGAVGQLGYGNTDSIGDNETPGRSARSDLGTAGGWSRSAPVPTTRARCSITAKVRCWG